MVQVTALRTLVLAVVGACLTSLGLAATAAPAHADAEPSDDVVRELTIEMDIDAGGTVHVTETYVWDFGDREGLGFYRDLLRHATWPHDSDLMRVYAYDQIETASPSGAPAEHWVAGSPDSAYLHLEIGAPDGSGDTRTGTQIYEVSYTLDGALNAIRDDPEVPDQDELYWNVTGAQWDVRLENITTIVSGPAAVTDQRCWQGYDFSDQPCASDVQGDTVTFGTDSLSSGQEQTIAVAFPPDTFENIDPILQPRSGDVEGHTSTQQRVAAVTDPVLNALMRYWPIGVGVLLVGYLALVAHRVRRTRDDHFVGVPPGTVPRDARAHPVDQLRRAPQVAVRFTPPDNLRPAVVSRLHFKTQANGAMPATIVDLATRGFLTMKEAKTNSRGKAEDWELLLAPDAAERRSELVDYEHQLLTDLFGSGTQIRLGKSARTVQKAGRALAQGIARQVDSHGLFTKPVESSARAAARSTRSNVWGAVMAAAIVLGVLVAVVGSLLNLLPLSAAVLVWILVALPAIWLLLRGMLIATNYRRSATGRALYDQARGFKEYLSKAEANQIRFSESIDVFSRYLPYAIVFGEAERWAKIFAELQEQGRVHVNVGWYAGMHPGSVGNLGSMASSIGSFASSGAGGGSGMGGAGGAGGGGGGGGGGGR